MKKLYTVILLCSAFLVRGDSWTQKANFPGYRHDAIGFSIGNKGYVGLGINEFNNLFYDFWEYDPASDTWTQLAGFNGIERVGAIGCSDGKNGYVGLGYSDPIYLDDWWQYDPNLNLWTQKNNFPGGLRYAPTCFTLGNYIYVGNGVDSFSVTHKDWWKYDPSNDIWNSIDSIPYPVSGSYSDVAFSVNGRGYVVAGYATSLVAEYDSSSLNWTLKNNCPFKLVEATGFSLAGFGYVGTGDDTSTAYYLKDFWQYNPLTDQWIKKSDFGGVGRDGAFGFSIGSKGYIGAGLRPAPVGSDLSDFWEYTPDSTTGINEINSLEFSLYPNPMKNNFTISFSQSVHEPTVTIFNTIGEKVFEKNISATVTEIPVHFSAAAGIYFLKIKEGERERVMKIVVEQ